MSETPAIYNVGDRPLRPQLPPSFEVQLKALPPAVRSVAGCRISRAPPQKKSTAEYPGDRKRPISDIISQMNIPLPAVATGADNLGKYFPMLKN